MQQDCTVFTILFFFKGLGKLQKIAPVRTCKPCLPILHSFSLGSFIHTSSLRLSIPNKPFTLKCSTHIQVDAIESPKCLLSKISPISLYFMGLLSPQSLESYPWCHLWFLFVKHAHKWNKDFVSSATKMHCPAFRKTFCTIP